MTCHFRDRIADIPSLQQERRTISFPSSSDSSDCSNRARSTDFRKFFHCGKIFKVVWADPNGSGKGSGNSHFMTTARDQDEYFETRRFVIVSRQNNHCQVLPIITYGGKGHKKRNIKLEEHGLIYTSERPPLDTVGRKPTKTNAVEDLDSSYINYAKIHCVEYNVKVKGISILDSSSRRFSTRYCEAIHFPDVVRDQSGLVDPNQIATEALRTIAGLTWTKDLEEQNASYDEKVFKEMSAPK
jgi:hypothetical protein